MGVFPGFSGQKFIETTYERCNEVKEMIVYQNANTLIQVDGGVTIHNAKKLLENVRTLPETLDETPGKLNFASTMCFCRSADS